MTGFPCATGVRSSMPPLPGGQHDMDQGALSDSLPRGFDSQAQWVLWGCTARATEARGCLEVWPVRAGQRLAKDWGIVPRLRRHRCRRNR